MSFGPFFAALRRNLRPFLLIQGGLAAAVAGYYLSPGFAALADRAGVAKTEGGYLFSAVATSFAGFVLPEIAKRLTGHEGTKGRFALFQIVFFALGGCLVDTLYRGLAGFFGDATDLGTMAKKLVFDQFVFSPLVSIPLSVLAFSWAENGFDGRGNLARARARYPETILACWVFWIPTLAFVFSLPSRLQFVLFLFAQGAWSLLLVAMGRDRLPPPVE